METKQVLASILVLMLLASCLPCSFVSITQVTIWRRGETAGKALQKTLGLEQHLYQILNWNLTAKSVFVLIKL